MAVTLNLSKEEKTLLVGKLKRCEARETKTQYEEFRCVEGKSTVTIYTSGKVVVQGSDERSIADELLRLLRLPEQLVLGIDETGRGEGTGPFVIAAVLADRNKMRELRDSKKLQKSAIAEKCKIVKQNAKSTSVVSISSAKIDEMRGRGMTMNSIEAEVIDRMLEQFQGAGKDFEVVVDGSPLPVKSRVIKFVVGADDKEPVVGAASVLAKFTRDESGDKGIRKSWKSKNEQP